LIKSKEEQIEKIREESKRKKKIKENKPDLKFDD